MKVLLLPVDDARGASTRYRVLAHLPALRRAGFRPSVRFPPSGARLDPPWRYPARLGEMLRDTAAAGRHDLTLVHRKTYPPRIARALAARAGRFVFDLDDAIDLPPPGAAAGESERRRYRSRFLDTVRHAHLVLCGNDELMNKIGDRPGVLLPTPIDTDRFRPDLLKPPASPALGWVGHSDNLPYLEALSAPMAELARRHPGLRLIVVADRAPRVDALPVEFRRWRLEEELRCFEGISVGLMPLDDSPWARAKCAFKAIQYMALGIPTVASPVGMNNEVIAEGESGFLPSGPSEWIGAVHGLLSDAALARRIGGAGRAVVEARYSLRVVSGKLVAALKELAAGERR